MENISKNRTETTNQKKDRGLRWLKIGVLLFLCISWIWSWIPVTERITLPMEGVGPEPVSIALVTDLHSCYYGKNQMWLVRRIEKENPDLVVLAGDIFDNRLRDKNAQILLQRLTEKYPCFYVTGNHEYWSGRALEMKQWTEDAGVIVLDGDCSSLKVGDTVLDICGMDDPDEMSMDAWRGQIDSAFAKTNLDHIRILVSHRPERVNIYEQYDFDLILTGHAHGGQFRIPFVNKGLLAPDQGIFAEYVNGIYELSNGSLMEVSRGLARETTPLPRFFNRPELVVIQLQAK